MSTIIPDQEKNDLSSMWKDMPRSSIMEQRYNTYVVKVYFPLFADSLVNIGSVCLVFHYAEYFMCSKKLKNSS